MLLPSKRLPAALSAAVARVLVVSAATLISACAVQTRVYAPAPVVTAEVAVPGAAVAVTAQEAPPPLPEYEQPPAPADGYLWTPGYWGYGGGGYYWVPGTWVQPPTVGVLWTPGYWGFAGGVYGFHAGYWGPHIGFYGGVNYGYGYVGVGFAGGRWEGAVGDSPGGLRAGASDWGPTAAGGAVDSVLGSKRSFAVPASSGHRSNSSS